jgi:hypothetical protein
MKLLRRVLVEGIASVLVAARVAQVIAEMLGGRFDFPVAFFEFLQNLADGFHVVFFEIVLGDLGRIVGGEHFDLYDKTLLALVKFLAAMIARKMQHGPKTSSNRHSRGATAGRECSSCLKSAVDRNARLFVFSIHPSQVLAFLSSRISLPVRNAEGYCFARNEDCQSKNSSENAQPLE